LHASGYSSEALACNPSVVQKPVPTTEGRRGFVREPELSRISDLLNNRNFSAARDSATALIRRPRHSFDSPKVEQFMKASAFFLKAEVEAQTGNDSMAMHDFKQAAAMGHPDAPYQVAARLVIFGTRQKAHHPQAARQMLVEAESFFKVGAELGCMECMESLAQLYRVQERTLEGQYWTLLWLMNQPADDILRFANFYREAGNDNVREMAATALLQYSPTGGPTSSTSDGVPGRSALTSAFVDARMKRQLAFTWRAFFSEVSAKSTGLVEQLHTWQDLYSTAPFAAPLLLIHGSSTVEDSAIIPMPSRPALAARLLPGDELVVRCGSLAHQATVWEINKSSGTILLLDPFYEFWQPTHNRCVTAFEVRTKYGRTLASVSLSEVQAMLVGVFAFRDRR
jgi:hypothetical protein